MVKMRDNQGSMAMIPPVSKPLVRRADTRKLLIKAAIELFSMRGYDGVSVREIIDVAGVNIAAVHYHFGSKMELYVEAVRRALDDSNSDAKWCDLDCNLNDRRSATLAIARFVRSFLFDIVTEKKPSAAYSLIIREAAQPSDAVDAVIHNFIQPNQQRLTKVIAAVNPSLTEEELRFTAESLMGQILHYRMFGEFLGRVWDADLSTEAELDRVAEHIARFSLAAIGCKPDVIDCAVASLRKESSLHLSGDQQ